MMYKNRYKFILCFLFLSGITYSQWSVGPVVANIGANPSISAVSSSVAWIAGNTTSPVIYRTTNGGLNWTSVPTNGIGNVGIYCIWGISATTAYVGTGTGNATVYFTSNGGTNWSVLFNTVGVTSFYNGIVFSRTNPNFGIAQCDPPLGPGNNYYIQKTTNGGTNWSLINPPGYSGLMSSQHSPFLIDNNFFGYGADNNGIVFITSNGGTNWYNSYVGRSGFVSGLSFNTDKLNGMAAVSQGGLSKTTNGGLNWSTISVSGIDGAFLSFCYWIPGTTTVFASSSGGGIRKSVDAGVTWAPITAGTQVDIRHMDFVYIGGFVYAYAICGDGTTLTGNEQPLPVKMTYLNAEISSRDVKIRWATSEEINNKGFDIERRSVSDANSYTQWEKIGFTAGNGNTNSEMVYSFTDTRLTTGHYNYRLKQVDYNGNYEYFDLNSPTDVAIGKPSLVQLSQNYPNPSNPSTKIDFQIPSSGRVSLKVYDISGREAATILDKDMNGGYYTAEFNGSNVSSGVYFYKLLVKQTDGEEFAKTMKMIVVK